MSGLNNLIERSLDFLFFFFQLFNIRVKRTFKAYFMFMPLQILQLSSVTSFESNNRLSSVL